MAIIIIQISALVRYATENADRRACGSTNNAPVLLMPAVKTYLGFSVLNQTLKLPANVVMSTWYLLTMYHSSHESSGEEQ